MSRYGMTHPPAFATSSFTEEDFAEQREQAHVRDAIEDAIEALKKTDALRAHAPRLVRTTGSYISGLETWEDTRAFLLGCDWREVSPESLPEGVAQPGVRYFRAYMGHLHLATAYQNTITVAEARRRGLTLESRVHKPDPDCEINPRGLGVFTPYRADVATPTREIWIIIGQYDGHEVPYTWHPGAPAVPVTKAMYDALDAGDWDNPILAEVNVHLPQ